MFKRVVICCGLLVFICLFGLSTVGSSISLPGTESAFARTSKPPPEAETDAGASDGTQADEEMVVEGTREDGSSYLPPGGEQSAPPPTGGPSGSTPYDDPRDDDETQPKAEASVEEGCVKIYGNDDASTCQEYAECVASAQALYNSGQRNEARQQMVCNCAAIINEADADGAFSANEAGYVVLAPGNIDNQLEQCSSNFGGRDPNRDDAVRQGTAECLYAFGGGLLIVNGVGKLATLPGKVGVGAALGGGAGGPAGAVVVGGGSGVREIGEIGESLVLGTALLLDDGYKCYEGARKLSR